MTKTTLSILVILSICGCAHQDEWTTEDTKWQMGVTTMLAIDAETTSRIQYCATCYESGPIARYALGSQPSTSDTIMYFATNAIANYLIARSLPREWRRAWQVWEIGAHGYAIKSNCDIGLC